MVVQKGNVGMSSINNFLDLLRGRRVGPNVFRPWTDYDSEIDASPNAPEIRTDHLRRYLKERVTTARWLLIAEAPGYQGCRFSGIAMTCERSLLGHKRWLSPELIFAGGRKERTSSVTAASTKAARTYGFCEPTATSVWRALKEFEVQPREVVLWNAFPFHPHRPGSPLTNRTPSSVEVQEQAEVLRAFLDLFPFRNVIPVGEVARGYLASQLSPLPHVRHPANGGVPDFRRDLSAVFAGADVA